MNSINTHLSARTQQGYSVYLASEGRRKAALAAKSNRAINPAHYGPAAIVDLSDDADDVIRYMKKKAS